MILGIATKLTVPGLALGVSEIFYSFMGRPLRIEFENAVYQKSSYIIRGYVIDK